MAESTAPDWLEGIDVSGLENAESDVMDAVEADVKTVALRLMANSLAYISRGLIRGCTDVTLTFPEDVDARTRNGIAAFVWQVAKGMHGMEADRSDQPDRDFRDAADRLDIPLPSDDGGDSPTA